MDNMPQGSPAINRARRTVMAVPPKAVGGAMHAMLMAMQPPEALSRFHTWRTNPTTILMVEALRELVLDPSTAHHLKQTPEIEYGVTQGLALAAQMLNDPSSLFPELFSRPAPEGGEHIPDPTYDVPPDDLFGPN